MKIKERQKLRNFVNKLSLIRGRHTELVSVYIPAGYDIQKIINHLQQEQGTASNIKDAKTRKHVQESIEKMIRHLRLFRKTPLNGLAVFCGNTSQQEGKVDIEVFSIEPPEPIGTRLYRCDHTFVLDTLKDMMEHKEIYGLITVDKREATLGILKGTSIQKLTKLTSGVPGKQRAGGQCCVTNTLIQSYNGEILEISKSHNPYKLSSVNMNNYSIIESAITDKWVTKKQEVYKIKTRHPQLIIECSKDHLFLVSTENGIIEKTAEKLKKEDTLLTPEKIEIKGKIQTINSKKYYNSFIINKKGRKLLKQKRKEIKLLQRELAKKINLTQTAISYYEIGRLNASKDPLKRICKELNINFEDFIREHTDQKHHQGSIVKLPTVLNKELAQFLGYYVGDGCSEIDRVTFFEQDKQVALDYQRKFNKSFNLNSSYRFRDNKNYHQLRFTSRPLVRLIKGEFPEIKKALDSKIPKKILKSPNEIVASFLKGFFDAEGYVNKNYNIGIASISKILIRQIQLLLLRFSIISSFSEYDNKKNPYSDKPIFKLQINEKQSLLNYRKYMGFTSKRKSKDLNNLIKNKSNTSYVRQIIIPGTKIREIIEEAGYNTNLFPKVTNFFRNKRKMSKQTFKNSILNCIKDKKLYKELKKIHNYNILPVQISKIEIINKPTEMIDISVKNQNFIANGLIVHNSAARFSRLREGAAKEFYKRISNAANKEFLGKENLKGILIGGPGHTKEEFLEYLNQQLRDKVLGLKDITYTDEQGLHDLVDKSQDTLAKEIVAEEKALMQKFFNLLAKEKTRVAYGLDEVKKALDYSAVEILLLSEDLDESLINELEEKAESTKAEIQIISLETREGAQLKDLGGVAAILRFAIE